MAGDDAKLRISVGVAAFVVASAILLTVFAGAVTFALREAVAARHGTGRDAPTRNQYLAGHPLLIAPSGQFACRRNGSGGDGQHNPSARQILQEKLDFLCARGYRREPANVIEAWSVLGSGSGVDLELCAAVVVPSTSWLARYATESSSQDPQALASVVLGSATVGASPLAFGAPTVGDTSPCGSKPPPARAVSTSLPRSPSAAPSTAPSPVTSSVSAATGSTATRVPPPLPTVQRPGSVAVVFTARRPAFPGEIIEVAFTSGPALDAGFSTSRLLMVSAGAASIGSVSGDDTHTVRRPHSVTATPDHRYGFWNPTVELDIPASAPAVGQPVVVRGDAHSAAVPNFFAGDELVFGIDDALPALAVVWAALVWRRRLTKARASADAQDLVEGVARTALVAGGVTVAAGLFLAVDAWAFRYPEQFGAGADRSLPMTGAAIAAVAFLAAVVPLLAAAARRRVPIDPLAGSPPPRVSSAGIAGAFGLVAVVSAVLAAGVLTRGLHVAWTNKFAAAAAAVTVAVVALLLWVRAATRFAGTGGAPPSLRERFGLVLGIVAVTALGAEAELAYSQQGDLVAALVGVVPTAAIALGLYAAARTITARLAALWVRPAADAAGTLRRAWQIVIALVVAAAVAAPGSQTLTAVPGRVTWQDVYSSIFTTSTLLELGVIVVLAVAVRLAERQPKPQALRTVRVLAASIGVLLWAPTQSWWYLPVGLAASIVLVRWWLLPSGRLSAADRLAATSEAAQTSSIIAATDAARMIKAIDAQLEEALAKDNPVDVVDSATAKLRSRRPQLIARGAVVDQFAHIAGTSAWHRGVMGARAATLLALPWIVLSIRADARQILSGGYHYRVGQFLTAATFDVLWWSGVGFVLGSAYPAIRGSNGLQKASALLATIAVPAFVTLLFPGPATHHHLVATIQTAAESASVLLVLGLLGDYFLLRRAGFGYRKLIETRRLSAVVTWATSLTVAIGAAVTSLLVAGVTGALTYLSTPNVQRPNSGSGSGTSQLVK